MSPSPPWSTSSPMASKRGGRAGAQDIGVPVGKLGSLQAWPSSVRGLPSCATGPCPLCARFPGMWEDGEREIQASGAQTLGQPPAQLQVFPSLAEGNLLDGFASLGSSAEPRSLHRQPGPLLFTPGLPRPALTSSQNQKHFTTSVALVSVHIASREEGMWC